VSLTSSAGIGESIGVETSSQDVFQSITSYRIPSFPKIVSVVSPSGPIQVYCGYLFAYYSYLLFIQMFHIDNRW